MDELRERWAGRLPFVMAAVGSAVGLGNIWRFPKVVYANDGGTFLIPYFIALITAGIPLMIVEYALGQKYQGGAPQALAAATKKFKWVGWFALLVGTIITFYYVVIMAWAFHYAFVSPTVAWAKPFDQVKHEINKEEGRITSTTISKDQVYIYYLLKETDKNKLDEEKTRVKKVFKDYKDVHILTSKELEDVKQFYEKENPDKEPDKEMVYVSFSENISNYFISKALDFQSGVWGEAEKHNDSIALEIEKIKNEAAQKSVGLTSEQKSSIDNLKKKKIGVLGHMMKPSWHLYIWAFITWVVIFLIIYKGVHNVGKVVMFTVPIPLIIIVVIAIKGLTLPGAWDGIAFYLSPNWSKLTDPKIWIEAYGQIFFSLSLGFGILIAYASYQPVESDITNNAFLTSFANCSTSFLGGFAVFSVLGYLAYIKGVDVKDVSSQSIGLAFITYPTAIAQMGAVWGAIIGLIFFICLLTLGIDSAFSILEGVITGVKDNFKKISKPLLTGIFCVIGFLVTTFVFASRSGLMWLDIADNWMSNYGLPLVGLFECIAIGYFADLEDLKKFINKHSEIKLHYWFDAFIKFITPAILIYLLGNQLLTDIQSVYGGYNALYVGIAGWGLFALLLILATLFAKSYHMLVWELTAGVCFLIFWGIYKVVGVENPGTIAGMTTLGTVLLLGGFFHCLYIALTEKLPAGGSGEGTEPCPEQQEKQDRKELDKETTVTKREEMDEDRTETEPESNDSGHEEE